MRNSYTWLLILPEPPRHTQPSGVLASSASSADISTPQSKSAGTVGRSTEGADRPQSPAAISEARHTAPCDETDPLQGEPLVEARLFVRGEESIRITTDPATTTLLVYGPGLFQNSYKFDSTVSLDELRQSYEQRVLRGGWVDAADRRASGRS